MRTFTDQVQKITDTFTVSSATDRLGRQTRAAVRAAYHDIATRVQWNYLLRRTQLNTLAPYSTGTVTYVASTRTLTLSGGVFPTWSVNGEVLINRNVYAVEQRVSDTQLILLEGRCPTVNISTAAEFKVVQTMYEFPDDFVELRTIVELGRVWYVAFLPPEEMLLRTQVWFEPSDILFYTVLGGGQGRMSLQFSPPPSTARTYDVIYQARPRPLELKAAYSTGTVTTVAGSATVNFSGAVMPASSAGAIFRVGTTLKPPEGDTGDAPAVEEHFVLKRLSDTSLLLKTPAVSSGTGLMYTIDDPIDLEPVSMLTLFDCMCRTRMLQDHQSDMNRIVLAKNDEMEALKMAIQADSRLLPKIMAGGIPNTLYDMLFGVTPRAS